MGQLQSRKSLFIIIKLWQEIQVPAEMLYLLSNQCPDASQTPRACFKSLTQIQWGSSKCVGNYLNCFFFFTFTLFIVTFSLKCTLTTLFYLRSRNYTFSRELKKIVLALKNMRKYLLLNKRRKLPNLKWWIFNLIPIKVNLLSTSLVGKSLYSLNYIMF